MSKITKGFTTKIAAYSVLIILGIALIALIVVLLIPAPADIREDTCKPIPDLPFDISFYDTYNTLTIIWNEPYDNPACGVTYRIDYSIDGGDEVITYVQRYYLVISDLEACSFLQVRIRAVNKFGDATVHFTEYNYTVVPKGQPVVNIEAFDTAEGVTLTWQEPPTLHRCKMEYRVTVKTELGDWYSEIVPINSMYIPWYTYCASLNIRISSWANRNLNYDTLYFYHIDNRTLEGIEQRISPEDPEELIVTWKNDTHQMLCGSVYEVRYSANDPALLQFVVTGKGEARFRFVYCMSATITIFTVIYQGPVAGPTANFDATQYPRNITEIQGYTIDVSQEDVTVISWLPASTTNTCNVTYRAQFTSDLGNVTYSDVIPPIELSKLTYCSVLEIQLQVLIGQHQVNSSTGKILESLQQVHNLEFVPTAEADTTLVEWSEHSKKEMCGLSYKVTYQYGSYIETFTTNQSSITLDTIYCTDTFIEVAAVRGGSVGVKNNITDKKFPDIVGKVQNITTSITENGILLVSWDIPRSVSQCNILYTVTDINDDATWCIGTSNCELKFADCPSELVITASYLDEEAITGEPSIIMYDCW